MILLKTLRLKIILDKTNLTNTYNLQAIMVLLEIHTHPLDMYVWLCMCIYIHTHACIRMYVIPYRFWPDPQTRLEPAWKFRVMNTIFQSETRNYPNPKNSEKTGWVGYRSTRRVRVAYWSCYSIGLLEWGLFNAGFSLQWFSPLVFT